MLLSFPGTFDVQEATITGAVSQGTVCLGCQFVPNSHAQGCYGIVTTGALSPGESTEIAALRCANCSSTPAQCSEGVATGTYTAYVYDIESDGQPSLSSAAAIIGNISVTGFTNVLTTTVDLNATSVSGSWTYIVYTELIVYIT